MRDEHIAEEMHGNRTIEQRSVENEIMKLVVDSYLHGAQTCELADGTVLGVTINQGPSDNVHLFIDNSHKLTVEIQNGCSRISMVKTIDSEEDLDYILPFTKSLGMTEGLTKRCVMETVTV